MPDQRYDVSAKTASESEQPRLKGRRRTGGRKRGREGKSACATCGVGSKTSAGISSSSLSWFPGSTIPPSSRVLRRTPLTARYIRASTYIYEFYVMRRVIRPANARTTRTERLDGFTREVIRIKLTSAAPRIKRRSLRMKSKMRVIPCDKI